MDNTFLPLFVQSGIYPARMDRGQTGSLLTAGGSPDYPMFPRPGVRPHGVDQFGERALRVTATGSVVSVAPGVAFVGGAPGAQGIEGIYVVMVNSPQLPLLPAVIPGSDQYALVGVRVSDPDSGGSSSGSGSWEVIAPLEGQRPTSHFLPLARVKIPGTGAAVEVVDNRTYTAALGGTVQIRGGLTELQSTFVNAPYGTQVYSTQDKLLYTRGVDGWAQNPSIATVIAGSPTIPGTVGQLLWEQNGDTLYVYDYRTDGSLGWIKIASAAASVRTAYQTNSGWPEGPNSAQAGPVSMDITIQGTDWNSIGSTNVALHEPAAGQTKPDEKELILQVRSTASRAAIWITVTADVLVQREKVEEPARALTLEPDPDNSLQIGVEVLYVPDALLSTGKVFSEEGPEGFYRMVSMESPLTSMTWSGAGGQRNFTIAKTDLLNAGAYQVRPMFRAQKYGYFKIVNLTMTVSTK